MIAASTSQTLTRTLEVAGTGPVEVTLTDQGRGDPVLLLHGGGGPASVAPFATLLAERGARVLTPVHPGFGGTPRPEALGSITGLAATYAALLADLELAGVTVVGNSIGGWIAAELALLAPVQVARYVLVDAVGLEVAAHPVADFFALTLPQVADLSYFDPDKFRLDPAALPPAQQAALAGNRAALAQYAGRGMTDPTLAARLGRVTAPTLVVWGVADRIADPEHGRAYAEAIPGAEFVLLERTGHMPQLETPEALLGSIAAFSGW